MPFLTSLLMVASGQAPPQGLPPPKETPASRRPASPTSQTPSTYEVKPDDWLSTIARDRYGPQGAMWTPYLCKYNKEFSSIPTQERITSRNCDLILPGQKLFLPPASVLNCMMLKDAGLECKKSPSEVRDELLGNIPPLARECVENLEANAPQGTPVAYLVMLAKALNDEIPLESKPKEYLKSCKIQVVTDNGAFQQVPHDFIKLDEDGKLVIVDIWGPEDY
ncbi:LysM peptidoglycan-binding domain-containing protein [bacterium]|nr:LysM peptidoglycan-binding domain-containing protein [bacterium]